MIPFPFSLLVLPSAAVLGVFYVTAGRATSRRGRTFARVSILALTWACPLATRGPGPIQLALGLLVGYLGVRMVALGERWRARRPAPAWREIFAAMLAPDALMLPALLPVTRPGRLLLGGVARVAACAALLVLGNRIRLWHWSRGADDLLVLVEVAVGTTGIHQLVVGGAGLVGRSVGGLQDHPLLSGSLREFWARRWNRLVQDNLNRGFFRPYGRRRRWALGTMMAFGASGIMHVIAVLDPERATLTMGPATAVMGFFLIHAGLVLAERRLGWHRRPHHPTALWWARARTMGLFVLLSPLLLDPFANVAHVHGRALGCEFRARGPHGHIL